MRLYSFLLILFLPLTVFADSCVLVRNTNSNEVYDQSWGSDLNNGFSSPLLACQFFALSTSYSIPSVDYGANNYVCRDLTPIGTDPYHVSCVSTAPPVCQVNQHLSNNVCVADIPPVCQVNQHLDSTGYSCVADAPLICAAGFHLDSMGSDCLLDESLSFGNSILYPDYIYIKQFISGQSVKSDFSLVPSDGYIPYEFTTPHGTLFYDTYAGGYAYSFAVTMSFAAPYAPQPVALSVPVDDLDLANWIVDFLQHQEVYAYSDPFLTDYFISQADAFWLPFLGAAVPIILDLAYTHWDAITGLFTDSQSSPNPEYSEGCTGGHSDPYSACLVAVPNTTSAVFKHTISQTGVDLYFCMVGAAYGGNVGCGGVKSGGNFLSPAAVAGRIAALFSGNRLGGGSPRGKAGALGGIAGDIAGALDDGFFGGKSGKTGPRKPGYRPSDLGKPTRKPPSPKRPRPDNDPEFDMVDCTDPIFMATQACVEPGLDNPDVKPVFGKVDGGSGLSPTGAYKDALEITCKSGSCDAVNKGDIGGTPIVNKPELPNSSVGGVVGKKSPIVKDLKVRSIPDSVKLIYDNVINHLGIPPKTTTFTAAECPKFTKMIPYFNKAFTIDEHCTLEPVIKPVTLNASRVAIGILALMIILKA